MKPAGAEDREWRFLCPGAHPAIRPPAFREPHGAGPIWGNHDICNPFFWTRLVEPEDFLGRLVAPGAGDLHLNVSLALIRMGGWCGLGPEPSDFESPVARDERGVTPYGPA